jgi:hypothetical protein
MAGVIATANVAASKNLLIPGPPGDDAPPDGDVGGRQRYRQTGNYFVREVCYDLHLAAGAAVVPRQLAA